MSFGDDELTHLSRTILSNIWNYPSRYYSTQLQKFPLQEIPELGRKVFFIAQCWVFFLGQTVQLLESGVKCQNKFIFRSYWDHAKY